jgi:hypothetical protein
MVNLGQFKRDGQAGVNSQLLNVMIINRSFNIHYLIISFSFYHII